MNSSDNLAKGTFSISASERIVFGQPLEEAIVAEAKRYGARRIFLTSTRSLAKLANGPLQRAERALGTMHVGTHTEISSHSPREDVIAGAAKARAEKADLLVAIGGGSTIDATKSMLMCLWLGLDSIDAMEPYRAGQDVKDPKRITAPADPIRMLAVSTTLSASEFTSTSGITLS
ncbi:MAG: iron-containing alcohol dehydrogenase, partial [Hyphomicrobiaceae bacterium]